jgi:hypothetical protein
MCELSITIPIIAIQQNLYEIDDNPSLVITNAQLTIVACKVDYHNLHEHEHHHIFNFNKN